MYRIAILLLFIPFPGKSQSMNCCKASATEQFAQLASTEAFAAVHADPVPLNFVPGKGKMISFNCADGKKGNAYQVMSTAETNKWLIIYHEWWGLNDYIKREAENFSDELSKVNILAIDLYDGKVAETAGVAQEIMQGLKDERARAIISGALAHIGSSAKIATLGWCFGGGWSLQTAIMTGKQGIACVVYYGMPEKDIDKLKKINSDVLGIYASKDAWLTPEVVKTFQDNMKTAGKKIIIKSYDADHAFANPSNPKYDKTSAENAHKLAMAYLKTRMK